MHLIERYALSTGLKIDNPFIKLKFYPLYKDKYVCFHASGKDDLRNYDYWNQVIILLRPIMQKFGYSSVQIGLESDPAIGCDIDLRGKTTFGQSAYVIKNCSFFIGVDSFPAHLAGFFDKKMIALYSNNFINCVKPYWGSLANKKLIDTPRTKGKLPPFSSQEKPKSINNIHPEAIVNVFCDAHKIEKIKFKTLFIGSRFLEKCIDVIPDGNFGKFDQKVNVRMDKCFNEQSLISIISNNICEVTTDKPISQNILKSKRIGLINYISDEFDDAFINDCINNGVKTILLCSSKEKISEQRFKFFNESISEYYIQDIINCNRERIKDIDLNNVKIASNKKIISSKKMADSYFEFYDKSNIEDLLLDLEWKYLYTNH